MTTRAYGARAEWAGTLYSCVPGLENYCEHIIGTYNFPTPDVSGHTLGGYSQRIVLQERYVLRIRHPEEQLAAVVRARKISLRTEWRRLLPVCRPG